MQDSLAGFLLFGGGPAGIAAAFAASIIPNLAHGGIVTKPTLGVLGEAGDQEAIIPLNSPEGKRLLGGGGGTSITFNDTLDFTGAVIMLDDDAAIDRIYREKWLPAKKRHLERLGRTLDISSGIEDASPLG